MKYYRKKTTRKPVSVERRWFIFDANGKTLGRFASEVCRVLRGRHLPSYIHNDDSGEGVIVLNASKVKVTGDKAIQKVYRHYSGFLGGLKEIPFKSMMVKFPDRIIIRAVKGMMPKTVQGRRQMKRLKVFHSDVHDMEAQQPIKLEI